MDPTGSAAGGSPEGRAQSRYDQLLKWMLTRAHDDFLAAFRSKPMIDDLLEYSSVAQAFFEEGEREGKREGERQMARRMALIALEGRFGPVSDELRAAIDAADAATLQEIVAHIATESLDQVRARLGL